MGTPQAALADRENASLTVALGEEGAAAQDRNARVALRCTRVRLAFTSEAT